MPVAQEYKNPEIVEVLRESVIIKNFLESPAWKVIQKLFKKEVVCIAEAMLNDPNLTEEKRIRYQERANIFGNFIPYLLAMVDKTGDDVIDALNEAKISLEDIF